MKLIKNATILWRDKIQTKMNIIYDHLIRDISKKTVSRKFTSIIDAENNLVIPGCIDAHVHFNDPGFSDHEDFFTGTEAAAAGGITTVIDMPCTSIPPITNEANLKQKLEAIQPKALIDFALWGGIRMPYSVKEIYSLWEQGLVGFKIYTISGMKTFPALSYEQISAILNTHSDYLFAFHAEDPFIIQENEKKYKMDEHNYSLIRSVEAEWKAVEQVLSAASSKNHLHFVHISSKKAGAWIQEQKRKMDVSWETCPHYLHFTCDDLPSLRGKIKTSPPVKTKLDQKFLRQQLECGGLDFITTDHAGCDFQKEKNLANFGEIYNGIPGTQLMIPYLFSEFYHHEEASLARLIQLTSENSAKRFGLFPQKGSLALNTDADFTIIDPDCKWRVDEAKLFSKGKYSPFHHHLFQSKVMNTIVRGEIVFSSEHGILGKPGFGTWIKRS